MLPVSLELCSSMQMSQSMLPVSGDGMANLCGTKELHILYSLGVSGGVLCQLSTQHDVCITATTAVTCSINTSLIK